MTNEEGIYPRRQDRLPPGTENHAGPRATIRDATRQAVPRWFVEFGGKPRLLREAP